MNKRHLRLSRFPKGEWVLLFRGTRFAAVALVTTLLTSGAGASSVLADEAFITSEKDNTVAVIDTERHVLSRKFKVGRRPRGIVAAHDGSALYVCASDSNSIQILDPVSGEIVGQIDDVNDPEQLALSPDGRLLYVSNEEENAVSIIDLTKTAVIKTIPVGVEPEGVSVSPDGQLIVVTSETTNMVHLIDAASQSIVGNILVAARPRFAAFTPDGEKLWVSSEIGGVVSVIDLATRKVERVISFAIQGVLADKIQPVGIVFSADGKRAFVALGPASRIAAVDVATGEAVKYILVGHRVWHMAMTTDGGKLISANGGTNDATIIAMESLAGVKSLTVGRQPWGIAVIAKE
ncbi:MAG: PQQ-dependent catabolism-associated beta-propeller protein [Hyphomicrobium sp.]